LGRIIESIYSRRWTRGKKRVRAQRDSKWAKNFHNKPLAMTLLNRITHNDLILICPEGVTEWEF